MICDYCRSEIADDLADGPVGQWTTLHRACANEIRAANRHAAVAAQAHTDDTAERELDNFRNWLQKKPVDRVFDIIKKMQPADLAELCAVLGMTDSWHKIWDRIDTHGTLGKLYRVLLFPDPKGQKLQQIKLTRQITGLGLKEAKDLVDAAYSNNSPVQIAQNVDYAFATRALDEAKAAGFIITITPMT